jgi:hypothetical protein
MISKTAFIEGLLFHHFPVVPPDLQAQFGDIDGLKQAFGTENGTLNWYWLGRYRILIQN